VRLCLWNDRESRQCGGENNQNLTHTLLPSNSQWVYERLPLHDELMGNHL
jgi:hypothetical protein